MTTGVYRFVIQNPPESNLWVKKIELNTKVNGKFSKMAVNMRASMTYMNVTVAFYEP